MLLTDGNIISAGHRILMDILVASLTPASQLYTRCIEVSEVWHLNTRSRKEMGKFPQKATAVSEITFTARSDGHKRDKGFTRSFARSKAL